MKAPRLRYAHHKNFEAYWLWFEYLRVALIDPRPEVQEALKRSASFYEPWGKFSSPEFELGDDHWPFRSWYGKHRHLFQDQYAVRKLAAGELPSDADALIVEIPLRLSQSVLIQKVTDLIREEMRKQPQQRSKNKEVSTAQFRLTEGAEPKLDALFEMLAVYRDVYLKHPKARGKKLLNEVRALYENRRQNPFDVPVPLDDTRGSLENRLRNVRRYIKGAKQIVLNVANGEFPGRY